MSGVWEVVVSNFFGLKVGWLKYVGHILTWKLQGPRDAHSYKITAGDPHLRPADSHLRVP
jgi:hypothetical protein